MDAETNQILQKAIEAHEAGKIHEAHNYYTDILKTHPENPDANHNLGVLALSNNRALESLAFFENAIKANPKIEQFWLSYISAFAALNKIEEAKNLIKRAKEFGLSGERFNELGKTLDRVKNINSSKQVSRKNHQNILDKLNLEQALKLAKQKAKQGFYDEAESIYHDILAKYPKNHKAAVGLKSISAGSNAKNSNIQEPPQKQLQPLVNSFKENRFEEALTAASNLITKFPNSPTLYNLIASANRGLSKFEEAIEAYKKVISLSPKHSIAHNNMGTVYEIQGKIEEALAAYQKAISLRPNYNLAHDNMGNVLKKLGRTEEAMRLTKKQSPSNKIIHFHTSILQTLIKI